MRVDLNVEDDAIAREVERRARYIYVCVHGATKDEGERKRALEDGGEEEKEKEEEKSGKG